MTSMGTSIGPLCREILDILSLGGSWYAIDIQSALEARGFKVPIQRIARKISDVLYEEVIMERDRERPRRYWLRCYRLRPVKPEQGAVQRE